MRIQSATVYLSASGFIPQQYKDAAESLGQQLAEADITIVYGGMDAGPMGLLARGGRAKNGRVVGVLPEKIIHEKSRFFSDLSETVLVGGDGLATRRKKLFDLGDVIVMLPGGFGTLDESVEVLSWAARTLHDKKMVIVNSDGFWTPIIKLLDKIHPDHRKHTHIVNSVDEVIPLLKTMDPGEDVRLGRDFTNSAFPSYDRKISSSHSPLKFNKPFNIFMLDEFTSAVSLRQLDVHSRKIGVSDRFNTLAPLREWMERAHKERFITDHCMEFAVFARTPRTMGNKVKRQESGRKVDLETQKWGASVAPA